MSGIEKDGGGLENPAFIHHDETAGASKGEPRDFSVDSVVKSEEMESKEDEKINTEKTIEKIRDHYSRYQNDDGQISKSNFLQALGDKKHSFFGGRFFDFLDEDKSGYLDMQELSQGARLLLSGTLDEKIGFIFKLYDITGDGGIERHELKEVLASSMKESCMQLSDESLTSLANALFDQMDTDGSGMVDQSELHRLLEKYPSMMTSLTNGASSWLLPVVQKKKPKKKMARVDLRLYLKNNWVYVLFVSVIILLNCAFWAINSYLYRNSNHWIILARGPGMCLDFDCSLVLLLPLRKAMTYLRESPLSRILPIDHNIGLHRNLAYLIIFLSIVHTGAHVGNAVLVAESKYNVTVAEFIFTTKANIGWVAGLAPVTGVFLVLILAIMYIFSMRFVRRGGHFKIFYWTHTLYTVFYVLLILHATHFWKWFLVAGVIFIVEKTAAMLYKTGRGKTVIEEICLLPSGVTQLVIRKPVGFNFSPGDYVHILIPAIANTEWHPFTISSAPEMEDSFWLHIRLVGHWTKKVREYFERYESKVFEDAETADTSIDEFFEGTAAATDIHQSMKKRAIKKRVNVTVFVEGPYGTPCREIFETDHAILIGAGIGVTPYAAIIQSIFYKFKDASITCPKCRHRWCSDMLSGQKLKRVDFIWMNRSQESFEWFADLLFRLENQLSSLGYSDAVSLHMYMTGAKKKQELQGLGIQVALDVKFQETKTDFLTGLGTRTEAGRPDFNRLFKEIKQSSSGKKKVFLCGSPVLASEVKRVCDLNGIAFSKEEF